MTTKKLVVAGLRASGVCLAISTPEIPTPVPAPLLNIPKHVIQAPGIRLLLSNLVGGLAAVGCIPSHFVQIILGVAAVVLC